jgi:hypothetical protein
LLRRQDLNSYLGTINWPSGFGEEARNVKSLNYFTQGYINNIKISEGRGAIRVDARCWRSMRKSQDPHNLHVEIGDDKLSKKR